MSETLPSLVAKLQDAAEVADIVEVALRGGTVALELEAPPAALGEHLVTLQTSCSDNPNVLGEPVGDDGTGMTLLKLRPVDFAGALELRDFIEEVRGTVALTSKGSSPPAAEVASATPTEGDERGDLARLPSDEPPAAAIVGVSEMPPRSGAMLRDFHLGTEEDPLLGRTLGGGRYEVVELIGRGGMGSVYLGRHTTLDRMIALKVMLPDLRQEEAIGERFHREALAASKLDHRNVMRVSDFGEEPDGLLYIAMELLDGLNLGFILETEGRLPLEQIVDIMTQTCDGLSAAHARGMVHRDVKPDNIMIVKHVNDDDSFTEIVKVCDFGIACLARSDEARGTGVIYGSPGYASPEQIRGRDIDGRSDVYSCGVILFEMATGELPFDYGDDVRRTLVAHLGTPPPLPSSLQPDIAPRLEQIILKALQKEPDLRQQTVRELRNELRALPDAPSSPGAYASHPSREDAARSSSFFEVGPSDAYDDRPAAVILSVEEEDVSFELDIKDDELAHLHDVRTRSGFIPAETATGVIPLQDPRCAFADFAAALSAVVAHTTYYTREHPEFRRSLQRLAATCPIPLKARGEIAFVRGQGRRDAALLVQTGSGESLELLNLLGPEMHRSVGKRLSEVFTRRHLVSLAFREGIPNSELGDVVELLAGKDMPAKQLRAQFHARELHHVSILFAEELLGLKRSLPWQVKLCISRLARDLRSLPVLKGASEQVMMDLRTGLIRDIVRPLGPEDVSILMDNADLIHEQIALAGADSDIDVARVLIDALPHGLCLRFAAVTLEELETQVVTRPEEEDDRAGVVGPRALIDLIGAKFIRERTVESDEVLRELHSRAILSFPELPEDLQLWVLAEQQAEELAVDPAPTLRALDSTFDERRYARELRTLERAMRVLARRARVASLWAVIARLERHAGDAPPEKGTREELAAHAARSLDEPELLYPVARVMLTSEDRDVREPAHDVLLSSGLAGAHALCDERRKIDLASAARARFVKALVEMGDVARPAMVETLQEIVSTAGGRAIAVAEELLRAAPRREDADVAEEARRFIRHPHAGVRRAAVQALVRSHGALSVKPLTQALDDEDLSVRVAAYAGLREIARVDVHLVGRIEDLMDDEAAPDDLVVAAVAALGATHKGARSRAVNALRVALMPPEGSGLIGKLRGKEPERHSPAVLEMIVKTLLLIGGQTGRREIDALIERADAELRARLAPHLDR